MLHLSSAAEYGLLLLGYLKKRNDYVSLSEAVEDLGLPKRFLARIAALMVKTGFLESKEGKTGGYKIRAEALEKTFYDFLEVFEEELALAKCLCGGSCSHQACCQHKGFLSEINDSLVSELKKYKLSEVLKNYA